MGPRSLINPRFVRAVDAPKPSGFGDNGSDGPPHLYDANHRVNDTSPNMVYVIRCSVCELDSEADELEEVFDLQERHRDEAGERHLLEFEKRER